MATEIWVNIGLGNDLLPDPLPEPMLTDHQLSPMTFISGQFHQVSESQGGYQLIYIMGCPVFFSNTKFFNKTALRLSYLTGFAIQVSYQLYTETGSDMLMMYMIVFYRLVHRLLSPMFFLQFKGEKKSMTVCYKAIYVLI